MCRTSLFRIFVVLIKCRSAPGRHMTRDGLLTVMVNRNLLCFLMSIDRSDISGAEILDKEGKRILLLLSGSGVILVVV